MIGILYGSFNMQGDGVTVTDTNVYSSPPNRIQADKLAESDGALVVKQQYDSKTFTVEGYLRADTLAGLETLMDTFKAAMAVKNQAFDIDYAGGVRRYLASAQNVIVAKSSNTTAGFSVEFLSPDGVGWDVDGSPLLSASTLTTSNVLTSINVGGTYQAEPLVTVTVNSLTGGTDKTITISNGTTLRGLSVTRTWTAGDVLEIDSLKKSVFVNDIPAEFSGQFPRWSIGDGSVSYLDDFSTRDVTIEASYTRRWL
ncbi:hypothetical protein ACFZAD_24625 [Streptomyces iakyrus]|uniref:phage distal tail protein n=1 Tax=Streptomyces iakyrus TaxID=68219 RepID=UPI0036EE47C7